MMNLILTIVGFISLVLVGGACARESTKEIVHENLKEVVSRLVEVEIELKNLRVQLTHSKSTTETNAETNTENKTETNADTKTETKTETKTDNKTDTKTGLTTGLKHALRRKRRYFHMKAKKDEL